MNANTLHPLLQHIQAVVPISQRDFDLILDCGKHKKLRKNQYLLQEGEVTSNDSFVLKGSLRQYFIGAKEKEHVVQFAFRDWWIGDWDAILSRKPSSYYIEALTSTEVLTFDYTALQRLFDEVPPLERYFRIMFQKSFAMQQKRILWMQMPAKKRYEEFLTRYGHFQKTLSQSQIASYLGITRESLSRLRKINQKWLIK